MCCYFIELRTALYIIGTTIILLFVVSAAELVYLISNREWADLTGTILVGFIVLFLAYSTFRLCLWRCNDNQQSRESLAHSICLLFILLPLEVISLGLITYKKLASDYEKEFNSTTGTPINVTDT